MKTMEECNMQNNKNNGQTRSWNNQNSENVKKGARLKVIAWVIFVIILLFGELLGFGLAAAINMKDGLVKLLKKDYLNHGIAVSIDENNEITLDFHVIISYGVSVATVADNLMETVKYKVESFTGMTVKAMNIYVEGVRVID